MNEDQYGVGGLRGRIANGAEDRLGRALTELLDSPVVSGAIGRAFDAREKAAQAQELAMGALNLPSATDIERLTRRLRSFSQRLEGIEDGVSRIDRSTAQRLSAIESQLDVIAEKVEKLAAQSPVRSRTSRAQGASGNRVTPKAGRPSGPSRPTRSKTKPKP
jgi:hypothetical protein